MECLGEFRISGSKLFPLREVPILIKGAIFTMCTVHVNMHTVGILFISFTLASGYGLRHVKLFAADKSGS